MTQTPISLDLRLRFGRTTLLIYRLRNYGDLESIIEEMSATHDKQALLHMYHEAVIEPYSFLYINLVQTDKSNMFMSHFK